MVYIPQGKGHGGVIRILITFNAQIEKEGGNTLKNNVGNDVIIQVQKRAGCLFGVLSIQFCKTLSHIYNQRFLGGPVSKRNY